MSHFIIDCSENILELISPDELMQIVYESAETSGLFACQFHKYYLIIFQMLN